MPSSPPTLHASSGAPQLDALLGGLLRLVALVLPGRLRSAYVSGSHADRSATSRSDLDATLVFGGQLSSAERQRFKALIGTCRQIAPLSLDIVCLDQHELARLASAAVWAEPLLVIYGTSLVHSSRLIAGVDLRATIPPIPPESYTRVRMHFPYDVLSGQRGHPAQLRFPLDGPDPSDPFLGYTGRQLRGPDGRSQPSTKRLVHASGFIATALLALEAGAVVGDTRTAVTEYARLVGGEWAALLEQIHRRCRRDWDYAVPAAESDRAILRELCRSGLALENYFLVRYRDYLLAELRQPDPAVQLFALQRLGQIVYGEVAVTAAVRACASSQSAELRQAAAATLRCVEG